MGFKSLPDFDGDIFRSRDYIAHKIDIMIQVLMVKLLDNVYVEEMLQHFQIDHHTCLGIGFSRDGYLDIIIVAVPTRVVAFIVYTEIFFIAETRVMKSVCCTEMCTSCNIDSTHVSILGLLF
jgi:hypothetical protein